MCLLSSLSNPGGWGILFTLGMREQKSNITWVKDKQWVKEGSQIQIHVSLIQSSAVQRFSVNDLSPFSVTISGISEASQSFLTTLFKFIATLSPRQKQSWLYNIGIAALFPNMNFHSVLQLLELKIWIAFVVLIPNIILLRLADIAADLQNVLDATNTQ